MKTTLDLRHNIARNQCHMFELYFSEGTILKIAEKFCFCRHCYSCPANVLPVCVCVCVCVCVFRSKIFPVAPKLNTRMNNHLWPVGMVCSTHNHVDLDEQWKNSKLKHYLPKCKQMPKLIQMSFFSKRANRSVCPAVTNFVFRFFVKFWKFCWKYLWDVDASSFKRLGFHGGTIFKHGGATSFRSLEALAQTNKLKRNFHQKSSSNEQ